MGTAIGGHVLSREWPLTVTDPRPQARAPLVERGAWDASSAAEVAAASDLTLVVVVDDAQVREVVAGSDGLLEAARPGAVIAVCAAVRPQTCRNLADDCASRGLHLIDVGLVRGERGAEAGTLLLLCGGVEAAIDACRPVFEAFATDVLRMGDVGAGQVGKMVGNILLWACIRADYEALRLGRSLGVDPATLRAALALAGGANRPMEEWGQHRLRWPGKDLALALEVARERGVDMPLIEALEPLMLQLSVEDLHDLL